jgi:hypothetical protein
VANESTGGPEDGGGRSSRISQLLSQDREGKQQQAWWWWSCVSDFVREKKRIAMERDGALPLLFSFSTTLPLD